MKFKFLLASHPLPIMILLMMAPSAAVAVEEIDDGATYTVSGYQTAGEDFDVDHQVGEGGGTLEITSTGTLAFSVARTINNSHGDGQVLLDGTLLHNAAAPSSVLAPIEGGAGSIVRASQGAIYLGAGGTYAGNFDADGGDIYFSGGSHLLNGATISGNGSVYAFGSSVVSILSDVNPSSGAATGGLVVQGGSITSLGGLLGGLGTGTLSVERASFGDGTIHGAKVRITGTGGISGMSKLDVNNGSVINEGTFTHGNQGEFDVDPDEITGGSSLVNHGTWNMEGFTDVSNTHGEGEFINHGTVRQVDPMGISLLEAKFTNRTGATLRADAGSWVQLFGGGIYEDGSQLVADGDITMRSGTHFLYDATLTGGGSLRVDSANSAVVLLGSVGTSSGAATGGFALTGGKISGTSLVDGAGNLAAERGEFHGGTIDGAHLRFTGVSEKWGGTTTYIDFGSLTNEGTMVQRNNGHFQLDREAMEDFSGIIVNQGAWTLEDDCDILGANGEGLFRNENLLVKTGDGKVTFFTAGFRNTSGATLQVAEGSLLALSNGGIYESGTNFHADGDLALGNGSHAVFNSNLTGTGYLGTLGSGSHIALHGGIGPITGPATGGFHLNGGTITNNGGIFGGLGVGIISAERGKLGWGTIDGATLRFTGASEKPGFTEVEIRNGRLVNEGTLTQAEEGNFELDSDEDGGNGGIIENLGTWSITAPGTINSYYGDGAFQNHGLLQMAENAGNSILNAFFRNEETGTLRVHDGASIFLTESSLHAPGSVLDVADGPIYLSVGAHLLDGCEITGDDAVKAIGDATHIISRVGAETGPSTGGFSIEGGVLRGGYDPGVGGVISGLGVGHIAVDHGRLTTGRIQEAHLRYTGNAGKLGSPSPFIIADGSLTIDGTFTHNANGSFELHAASPPNDGGTIHNNGAWQSLGASVIYSTTGGGLFLNAGPLTHAAGNLTISAPFENAGGGTVTTGGGTVILNRDTTHQAGSVLDAANGNISLQAGTHIFHGGAISGAGYVQLSSGTMQVLGDVGTASGLAGGRLLLSGGTLHGTSQVSVSDVNFQHGLITGGVTLRMTGISSKSANEVLSMNGGTILNEGVLSFSTNAQINLDSAEGGGAGVLRNDGEFYALGGNVSNSHGAGVFQNNGLARNDAGNQSYFCAFENLGNGRLRNQGSNIYLSGGGQHFSGSVLEAAPGAIYLNGGTHTFHGGGFEGAGMTYCTAGTMLVQGDVGAPTGPATGGFGIAGGTVTGSGTVSAERGYFSSGTLGGSVVLRFTTGFTKAAGTVLNMNGGTLQSDGLYDTPGGTDFNLDSVSSAGAGTIINGGVWRLNNASNYSNSHGGGRFVNGGLMESMLGNSNLYCAFDSMSGSTLRANAGILRLHGGGIQHPGAILHTNGGDIYYAGGAQQLLGGTFAGPGYVYATGGTVSVEGDVGATTGPATGGFGISSGTVTGTAMISAERGSFLTGSVGGSVTLRFTGSSTKWGGSVLGMNGGTIRNEGTMTHQGGGDFNLDSASGAGAGTLINTGTWNQTGASNISNAHGAGLIENHGLWQVIAGNSVNYSFFNHHMDSIFRVSGGQMIFMGGSNLKPGTTLDANGGHLYLNGGTHTFEGGGITGVNTVYTGGGNTVVAGDVGATTGAATGGFGLYANGLLTGTAMLSVERGYFGSGTMAGDVTLRLTGASQKVSNSTISMNGGTLRNEGVMTHVAGGGFDLDNSSSEGAGTILNIGTWNQTGGSTFSNANGGGQIDNHGLWHVSSGNSFSAAAFTQREDSVLRLTGGQMILAGGSTMKPGATIDADGGYLYFGTGTHTLEGGTITGDTNVYTNAGSTVVTGDVGATGGAATGGYGIVGGTVSGTGMISTERGYFGSGTMAGDVTLRLTGASQKISGSTIGMNGGTLRNEGVMTHVAGGGFDLDNSSSAGAGTILNIGTWNQTGGSTFSDANGGGQIDNHGLWHVVAGNSSSAAAFTLWENSILRVTTGQMILSGGSTMKPGATIDAVGGHVYFSTGTHTLEGGTITGSTNIYTNAGSTVVTGNVGATSGAATGGYGIVGGTLSGTGMISTDRGYLGAGSMAGAVTLRYTGESVKITNTSFGMSGGTILNEGTMTVAPGTDFNLDTSSGAGGGAIVNDGTWIQTGGGNYLNSNLAGTFQNNGTFRNDGGTTQIYGYFTNTGITRVDSGTLHLRNGSVHTGALISNGSVSFIGSGHSLTGSDAYLGGSGSFSGNVTLAEGAGIAPGNSTGTLALNGTVQLLAGTKAPEVRMELAGAADFDHIVVGNGANLALGTGVTDLLLDLQFQPMPGQTFRIISAGAGTGVVGGRFRNAPTSGDLVAAIYQGNPYHFRVDHDAGGKFVDLVYQSGYELWIAQNLLTGDDAAFDADPDGDGVSNGIEFITGRDPRPGFPDPLLPDEQAPLLDETHLIFVHRRLAVARYLPTVVQYNTNLSDIWTHAQQGVNGVVIETDEDFHGAGIDKVETRIPRALADDGRMFVRLWSRE